MKSEKFKIYTLYANLSCDDVFKYTPEERAHANEDDNIRGLSLMFGERIENLDALTSGYDSEDELLSTYMENVYGEKVQLYNPVIIVDKDQIDRSKSYVINEIVFKEDAIALQDREGIREAVRTYLYENPGELIIKKAPDVNMFRGISKISTNIRNKYPNIGFIPLVNGTLNEYFIDNNYKRYREAYFTLKKISRERKKNNGIRR